MSDAHPPDEVAADGFAARSSDEVAVGGFAARSEAARLLEAALSRRNGLEEAASAPAFTALSAQDRGFARALVLTTLRWLGPIDRALDAKLKSPPPDAVRTLLRLGAAQLWRMEVPAYAAVDTSVALTAAGRGTERFKGLVNAVLRGLERDERPDPTGALFAPDWLGARWRATYGEDAARAIAGVIPREPPTDLTLKERPSEDLGVELEARAMPTGSLRSDKRGDVASWPRYMEGAWWVQDAAAAIPAQLLAARPGETALDLCAAPGGKTLQLTAAGARVTALDRSPARVKRLRENLARTGLEAEVIAVDATAWPDARTFDAVLLDAPCTATGTFRRHPDVLWVTRPGDIASMVALQSRLLDEAAARTRPGGRLVYCTCSLEPEEGEAQIVAFLRRTPEFARLPVAAGEAGAPVEAVTAEGELRILPSMWAQDGGLDGFYIARLERAG